MNKISEIEKIRRSDGDTITVKQAADALNLSYIMLLRKMKNGEDVIFPYHRNGNNFFIIKSDFLQSYNQLQYTLSFVEMLKTDYITVRQAAECMKCSEATLMRNIKNNNVPFNCYQSGGKTRIDKQEFINFMKGT